MSEKVVVNTDWTPRLTAAGLADPRVLLDHTPDSLGLDGAWTRLTKPGLDGRERWRWELPREAGGGEVYLKRYFDRPFKSQSDRIIRQTWRASLARWEYEQAQLLATREIAAPAPIAYGERMRGAIERRSFVMLGAVPGDGLDRVWSAATAADAAITRGRARIDLITRFARFAAAFHEAGMCHRDLYLCHIFADLCPNNSKPPRFALIDLARVLHPRVRRMRWIVKDLAQIDASARQIGATRTDRHRFLLRYLGLETQSPRVRRYSRLVARKSDWILRRIHRRARRAAREPIAVDA